MTTSCGSEETEKPPSPLAALEECMTSPRGESEPTGLDFDVTHDWGVPSEGPLVEVVPERLLIETDEGNVLFESENIDLTNYFAVGDTVRFGRERGGDFYSPSYFTYVESTDDGAIIALLSRVLDIDRDENRADYGLSVTAETLGLTVTLGEPDEVVECKFTGSCFDLERRRTQRTHQLDIELGGESATLSRTQETSLRGLTVKSLSASSFTFGALSDGGECDLPESSESNFSVLIHGVPEA